MEWALPPAPKAAAATASTWAKKSSMAKERPTIAAAVAAANATPSSPAAGNLHYFLMSDVSIAFVMITLELVYL